MVKHGLGAGAVAETAGGVADGVRGAVGAGDGAYRAVLDFPDFMVAGVRDVDRPAIRAYGNTGGIPELGFGGVCSCYNKSIRLFCLKSTIASTNTLLLPIS